jgi:hypothetical protein
MTRFERAILFTSFGMIVSYLIFTALIELAR